MNRIRVDDATDSFVYFFNNDICDITKSQVGLQITSIFDRCDAAMHENMKGILIGD